MASHNPSIYRYMYIRIRWKPRYKVEERHRKHILWSEVNRGRCSRKLRTMARKNTLLLVFASEPLPLTGNSLVYESYMTNRYGLEFILFKNITYLIWIWARPLPKSKTKQANKKRFSKYFRSFKRSFGVTVVDDVEGMSDGMQCLGGCGS